MSSTVQHPVFDMEILKGADEFFSFQYMSDNNVPIPLTGYAAKMEIRDKPGGDLFLTLTQAAGITIVAATGLVAVAFTHAQTLAFEFENGEYDLFLVSPASVYTCIARGKFTVFENVTEW